jgi:hypothetical protein
MDRVVAIPLEDPSRMERDSAMPYSVLAFLGNYCQTVGAFHPVQDGDGQPMGNQSYALGFGFAQAFVQSATSCHLEIRKVAYPGTGNGGRTKPGELVMQYHFRCLAAHSNPSDLIDKRHSPIRHSGIQLRRNRASIRHSYKPRSLTSRAVNIDRRLIERVSSFSLSILNTVDAPYTIIVLMDDETHPPKGKRSRGWRHGPNTSETLFPSASSAQANGLRPCGRCTGLNQFFLMVLTMFERWEAEWMYSLNHLDHVAAFSVSSTQYSAILNLNHLTAS